MIQIRAATQADYPAVAEVSTRANPDDPPVTLDVIRWVLSRARPDRPHALLVAAVDGQVVGHALLRGITEMPSLILFVEVLPEHRRRGIGGALLDAVLADTGDETEVVVPTVSAASPESIRFAEQHGFVERDRVFESTLDMAIFDASVSDDQTARLVAEGYRFSSLAEEDRPKLRRALHRLHLEATRDIPTSRPILPVTYAEWVRDWIKAPHALPESFAIALWGDEPAAFSYVISQSEGVGYMWMTAVAREHRSNGLGLAIKVHALRAAAKLGLREVLTNNDPDNAPMLAINRRLGFRDRPARIEFKKTLPGTIASELTPA